MSGRIWVDGLPPIGCRSATFTMWVLVSASDPSAAPEVGYDLSITVDDSSGEDGAAMPQASRIPVTTVTGGRHPSLRELGGLRVCDDDDGEAWNSWFGNDAAGLAGNDVRFGGWNGTLLRVVWTATNFYAGQPLNYYDPDEGVTPLEPGTFRFEGEADMIIAVTYVAAREDGDRAVAAVWGAALLDRLSGTVTPCFPIEGSNPVRYKSAMVEYRLTRSPDDA